MMKRCAFGALALCGAFAGCARPVPASRPSTAPAPHAVFDAGATAVVAATFRGAPLGPPDLSLPDVDAQAYALDLTLSDARPGHEAFTATLTGTFVATRALTAFALDFEGRPVDSVTVDGAPATSTQRDGSLVVTLPRDVPVGARFEVAVRYGGSVVQGTAGGNGFNDAGGLMVVQRNAEGRRQFLSLNWPARTRTWLPVRDHPRDGAMIAVRATFPAALTVFANGRRAGVHPNPDGTITWSYEALTPMPVYDLHVSAYDHWDAHPEAPAANGVTVVHMDDGRHGAQAADAYRDMPRAMDYFVATFGAFRWGSLAYLEEPDIGGGMEHATVISMDERMYPSAAVVRNVAVHEMAHHWSGNLVRVATWNDLWLSEGFADYLTSRFIEDVDGAPAGLVQWADLLRQGLQAEDGMPAPGRPVRPSDPEQPGIAMFTPVVYKHGAFALRMLEDAVGREALTTFLHEWFDRHAWHAVTTETFRAELEDATHRDLGAFFAQWIAAPHHPLLATETVRGAEGALSLRVRQVQTRGPTEGFRFPLTVAVRANGAEQRLHVDVNTRDVAVPLPAGSDTATVVLDPDVRLFATAACGPRLPRCRAGWTCEGALERACLPPAAPQ